MVSVLLVTHNRPQYLRRTLLYYSGVGFGLPIVIADSSEGELAKENEAICSEFSQKLDLQHLVFPGEDFFTKFSRAAETIPQPFLAISGDDDYLIEESVVRCAGFLDQNPGYSVADGRELRVATGGADSPFNSYVMPQLDIESDCPATRLEAHLTQYWPTFYGVHRKENIAELALTTHAFQLDEKYHRSVFLELYLSALVIVRGKYKNLPGLHIVRQNEHNASASFLSWELLVTNPDFLVPSKYMRDSLAEMICSTSDSVDIDSARKAFNRGFDRFLAYFVSLVEDDGVYTTVPTKSEFKQRMEGTFFPVREKTKLADPDITMPGASRYFTLAELQDKGFPFYRELLPILANCVSHPTGTR